MDSDDCVRLLGQNQIVAGVVRTYSQVLASADLSASGMLVEAKTKEGGPGYLALGLPYSLESVPRNAPSATPRVGADSDVLLAEVGYLENEVEALRAAGVIA
jgi:crotonobetainyl-CoA:carnitine CoA-transferase CaiB-like acyl-CoA transferase